MIKRIVLAASMMAIGAMASEAFAHSTVAPKRVRQEATSGEQPFRPFNAFDQTVAPSIAEPGSYRYHGGPKQND